MSGEKYVVRIRRELVLNGYHSHNHKRLVRYMARALWGKVGMVGGYKRYKAAAKSAFGEFQQEPPQ